MTAKEINVNILQGRIYVAVNGEEIDGNNSPALMDALSGENREALINVFLPPMAETVDVGDTLMLLPDADEIWDVKAKHHCMLEEAKDFSGVDGVQWIVFLRCVPVSED